MKLVFFSAIQLLTYNNPGLTNKPETQENPDALFHTKFNYIGEISIGT